MTKSSKIENNIFPTPKDLGKRLWGTEELLFLVNGNFMMKKLTIKAGQKGGLQYHRFKNEGGYLVSGKMIIRYQDEKGELAERILVAGESFHFNPGVIHQEEAITDCVIIEGSTPHFNDRVRCEEKFGMENNVGLPSTNVEDVEYK